MRQDASRLEGDWAVASIRSGSTQAPVISQGQVPTARFASTIMTGNGGVNTYRAVLRTTAPDAISITVGPVTKIAGPPALMAQENAYLSALADTRHFRVTSDALELLDGQGAVVVTYARAVPVALEDNLWKCEGYNNGKHAVVSLVPSSTITIRFGREGRLSGSGGVNQYATSYKAVGASMTIDSLLTTTRMDGPAELMSQEKQYLHALQGTARFEIDGDELDLWGNDSTGRIATYRLAKP